MGISPRKIVLLVALIALAGTSCSQLNDLPMLTEDDLKLELAESSKIYAADGTLITTLHGEQNRTIIPLKRIPQDVQDAVIAIEDERFYEHSGVDVRAILRALVENVSSGEIREGGSTITQQYVKNVIIAPGETAEKTLERKLREAALARQLEKKLSKKQILGRYLNTVYFGEGAYGIQAAAKTYFGKSVTGLKLEEGALLAGLIRSPEEYDPFDHRKLATQRRNLVLDKMAELELAPVADVAVAKAKRIKLQRGEESRYPAPYFLDYVQRLITWDPRFEVVGKSLRQRTRALFQGGLKIYTTVDLDMQAAAEDAVAQVLTFESDPYASLVAIDPETGWVKAMVGGRNYFASKKEDQFAKVNLAILAEPGLGNEECPGTGRPECAAGTGRQAGSAFKPFALVAGIEEGVPLSKEYKAGPSMTFPGANAGSDWVVRNYESTDFGSKLSLLEATVKSVNVVYAQLILEVGAEAVVDAATDMGMKTNLIPVPSAVLGSNEVNPIGMASAYGTLANNGRHHPPVAITKIVDAEGKVLYQDETEAHEAISAAVASLANSALQQVVQRGTAAAYGNIGRPAAGKTGTAQEYRDAWFVGFTPDLVTAVWVGYPEGQIEMKPSCGVTFLAGREVCRPTRIQVTGGSWPTQIWNLFMTRALAGIPAHGFPTPSGTVTVVIDTRKGCLATNLTPPEFRGEGTFVKGTEPKKECRGSIYGLRKVPDVIGFPVEDAVRILEDDGFTVEQVDDDDNPYPPGIVAAQDPGAGERAEEGSTVVLFVSARDDNDAEVPNTLGMVRKDAEKTLKQAGFEVEIIYEPESDEHDAKKHRGEVWKQSPPGGTEAEEGSTVTIWVNPE